MRTDTKDAIILEMKQSLPPYYDYFISDYAPVVVDLSL